MKTIFLIFTFSLFFGEQVFAQRQEIDSLKKVLPTYAENDTNYINTLNLLAFKYQFSKPDTMIVLSEKSINLCQKIAYKKGQVEALKNKGVAFYIKGDYAQAIEMYLEALTIAEKIAYKKGISRLYNNVGLIYNAQGKYAEALENNFKSLKIREEIDDKQGIAMSLNNIADVYTKQGKYAEALKSHFKSLEIKEKIDDKRGISASLNNIAYVYYNQGKYAEALENDLKSLKIAEEIDDRWDIASSKNGLTNTYLALKNYPKALSFAHEALVVAEEIGQKELIRDINENLSKIYEATGKAEKAFFHYKQFKVYADSLNNRETEKKTANLQAQYEFDKKTAIMKTEQEAQKKQLYWLIFSAFAALLSVSLILFLIFRSRKKIQNAYAALAISNAQVQQAKEEIEVQAEELQQSHQSLNLAYAEIHEKNEDLTASITYAKRIQHAVIPKEAELQRTFPDLFVFFRPKDIVSGDFYWFAKKQGIGFREQGLENSQKLSPIHFPQNPDIYILAVADCTGHGVSGAFMTIIGNNILNQIIHDYEIHEPDEILNLMNPLLAKTLLHSEGKVADGMDISIVTISTPPCPPHREGSNPLSFGEGAGGGVIQYAGAMNPLYYVQNGELKEIKADKAPIGGKQKENFAYQKHTLQLAENSEQLLGNSDKKLITDNCTLYLCTDGFQDQFGGKENKKFMVKNLRKYLLEISNKPMNEQKILLDDMFDEWTGEQKQTDDVTIVGLRL